MRKLQNQCRCGRWSASGGIQSEGRSLPPLAARLVDSGAFMLSCGMFANDPHVVSMSVGVARQGVGGIDRAGTLAKQTSSMKLR